MDNQPIRENFGNLVIVPGHAVYVGTCASDPYDGKKWKGTYTGYKYNDEVPNYVRHIQRGVNLVDQDPGALLVFSGGKTRVETEISEAEVGDDIEENGLLMERLEQLRMQLAAVSPDYAEEYDKADELIMEAEKLINTILETKL